jgi:serine palmitoyltransferase
VPLFSNFESFHTRNMYLRMSDVCNRPICSVPGAEIELLERKSNDYNWTYYFTGKKIKAINMGSYNYLGITYEIKFFTMFVYYYTKFIGFAENNGPSARSAIQSIKENGVAPSSSRQEIGTLQCQKNLEALIAKFLGVESALTFGMGFATNSVILILVY